MKVAFLVPRRVDGGHRDALWEVCRSRWQTHFPDWPVVEGHHTEGPFNRGAAINRAAQLAGDWDVGVIIDSDVMVRRSQVLAAVERAAEGYVTWAHLRWRELSQYWTGRTLADQRVFGAEFEGVDLDVLTARTNPISWSCCIAVPRATFDDMGGFDERFIGWGYEDGAWESVVRGLYRWDRITVVPGDEQYPPEVRRPADVINLWHPRSAERIEEGKNLYTATNDYIRNGLLGRRYQIAVKRDFRVGDQVGEDAMSPERVEVHVANLKRQDARFIQEAVRRKMPEAKWVEWWPTLEELRDGWKAQAAGGSTETITVVVTSGGTIDTWPQRRAYLSASLASLNEQVTGSITQRVVYADWPDEVRPEVDAVAHEHGFYVVGDGHHGHTVMRQRLWRYLSKHAAGELVFATEDDFLYEQPVDLDVLAGVLRPDPHLAQLALLRDACYPDERETGGILGWPEPAFTRVGANGSSRLEHRLFWTNNPSIFRRSLTDRSWPATREDPNTGKGPGSEVIFGRHLLADPRVRFAFWGDGTNQVRHVGEVRAGSGY